MTNNELRHTVKTMLNDWNALSTVQREREMLIANIAASETELEHRLIAAKHLRGIPQRQNASSINTLYDALVNMNLSLIELNTRAAQ